MKKIFSLVLCGLLMFSITGCGNNNESNKVNDNLDNIVEEKEEQNNSDETTSEESNESYGDDANLKPEIEIDSDAKIVGKFVNSDDHDTYFILMDDNTFVGARNICAGHIAIFGTYEITNKTTLVGVVPGTLTLTYDTIDSTTNEKQKDVFKVTKTRDGQIMTNLTVDIELSDMLICMCTDYDFYIVDDE